MVDTIVYFWRFLQDVKCIKRLKKTVQKHSNFLLTIQTSNMRKKMRKQKHGTDIG